MANVLVKPVSNKLSQPLGDIDLGKLALPELQRPSFGRRLRCVVCSTRCADGYVPSENVIGRGGRGLPIALTALDTARLALRAICAGVSKRATKIAREFAGPPAHGAAVPRAVEQRRRA